MRDKQKCLFRYVGVIGNNIEMIVHLKINEQYNSIEILQNIIRTYRNLGTRMNENKREPKITHQQINSIFDSLLKIPKSHKMIHPCLQRSAYSDILQWLTKSISQLLRIKNISPRQLCLKQQQIIVSTLQQLIQLCKKECLQKGLILQMVLEYMVVTLKTHWKLLQNANRQVVYQFQNNSVKIQKEYSAQIKRLQSQNEEYRKDKEHRWRNMFMLIKDNRIHRRQNKKLKSTVNYQIEKNVVLAEQMLLLREQNEKMKFKLSYFENDPIKIEGYAQTHLKLLQMQEKIKTYPKKSKKILRNELIKIQIQQINNLNDRVKFITKAIEQSGEIIDQFYDDEIIWTNFHYNISTQTELTTDEKGTNTPILKINSIETTMQPADLSKNQIIDVYSIFVKGNKRQRKETKIRESKNVMFFTTNGFGSTNKLNSKKEQEKLKNFQSKRVLQSQFAICESVKMTIYNCRISYISTYNTQIFNGLEMIKKIEQKIEKEVKQSQVIKKQSKQVEIQTQPEQERPTTRHFMKSPTKFTSLILSNPISIDQRIQLKKKTQSKQLRLNIYEQMSFQYIPIKRKGSLFKLRKSSQPHNILDKEINEMSRNNLKSSKRLNSMDRFQMNEEYVVKKADKVSTKKLPEKFDFNSQYEENIISSNAIKNDTIFSQTNINSQNRSQKASFTKQTNISGNSSFLNSNNDLKKVKKQTSKNSFVETEDNLVLSKVKQPCIRNSQITPLTSIQQKKVSKITKSDFIKHKRNATQSNQLQNNQNELKNKPSFKMRALHRISQVFTEADFAKDDQKESNQIKQKIGKIPMLITRQGDIKNINSPKAFEKILKNIDQRRGEIISNNYTFKAYLTSYFKCVYGREIYQNFMTFLANSEPQQITICFLKLANCKNPDPYSADLFRGLVKTIGKCLLLGQTPTSSKVKLQILNTLTKMFLDEDEAISFSLKMKSKCCYSLLGWFNSLQTQIRSKTLYSELYQCLNNWMGDNNLFIASGLVNQITYFFHQSQDNFKLLIKSDLLLEQSIAFNKLCLFCNKYKWRSLLNIKTTIQIQYNKRIGPLNEQQALHRIFKNKVILTQFKNLQKSFKTAHYCFDSYGDRIDPYLLMLLQLNIQQYRLRIELPLSKQLKYLNFLYNGLQKKKQIYENKVKQENPQTKDLMFEGKS